MKLKEGSKRRSAISRLYRLIVAAVLYHVLLYYLVSVKFPPPRLFRQYHRCNFELIPYVASVLETVQFLQYHPNCSFIRFGDGEVDLILGNRMPFQEPSGRLSFELERVFSTRNPMVMIGLPDIFGGYAPVHYASTNYWYSHLRYREWFISHVQKERLYLNAKVSSVCLTYRDACAPVKQVYASLRTIWKGRDIVLLRGNNSQLYDYDIFDTASSVTTLLAPRYQAWNAYDRLKEELFQQDPKKLFILSAGPVAKVLALDLAENGRRVLDLGHLAKDYDYCLADRSRDNFFTD